MPDPVSRVEISLKVRAIFVKMCGVHPNAAGELVTIGRLFGRVGSFGELMFEIRQSCGVDIEGDLLHGWTTVGQVVDLVDGALRAQAAVGR